MKQIVSHPLKERFINDIEFRTMLFLRAGFAVNLVYCVIQVVFGIFYRSLWAGALAVFHFLLAVMRFLLLNVRNGQQNSQSIAVQWRKYRICGVILLCMTPLFASILILVVHKNSGSQFAGPVIYLMAIYTFFAVILSIISAARLRKGAVPVLYAATIVKLIAALMSVLSLETAMLTRFDSADNPIFRQGLTGTTGGAVSLFVLGTAIYMVVQGAKK